MRENCIPRDQIVTSKMKLSNPEGNVRRLLKFSKVCQNHVGKRIPIRVFIIKILTVFFSKIKTTKATIYIKRIDWDFKRNPENVSLRL